MTDDYDYTNPPWLAAAVERFGEPRITPPEGGVRRGLVREGQSSYVRRAWVWFPGGVNHGLRIDKYFNHLEISIWGTNRRLERTEKKMLTDAMMIASMELVWGDEDRFEKIILDEESP